LGKTKIKKSKMPLNFGAMEDGDDQNVKRVIRSEIPVEGKRNRRKTVLLRMAGIGCLTLLASLFAFAGGA
jgi:hypothetical protein